MIRTIGIYAHAPHQTEAANAFAAGARRHGVQCKIGHDENLTRQADACVAWGWRIARRLKAPRRPMMVMERGYVGDRFKWTSLAWNGLNGRGTVPPVADGGARWRAHHLEPLPWREAGAYALVMGQVPGDTSIEGVDINKFYAQAAAALARFGLPVKFRPHPVATERGHSPSPPPGAGIVHGSLESALCGARVVITYNSNSATDAVLAGVPTIVCDQGAMAWPVAGHGLEAEAPTPDRAAWCAAMAWRQWKLDEIAAGAAWDYLKAGTA